LTFFQLFKKLKKNSPLAFTFFLIFTYRACFYTAPFLSSKKNLMAINAAATKQAEEDYDDDDYDIVQESLHDYVTKHSFAAMIDSATTGNDILKVTDLLPNSSQRYGPSIAMNAFIRIIF